MLYPLLEALGGDPLDFDSPNSLRIERLNE
jgi:hypothetical protein